jgi:hypothetical protein
VAERIVLIICWAQLCGLNCSQDFCSHVQSFISQRTRCQLVLYSSTSTKMDNSNHSKLSTPISSTSLASLLELTSQSARRIGNTSNGDHRPLHSIPPSVPQRSLQELLIILDMAIEIAGDDTAERSERGHRSTFQ